MTLTRSTKQVAMKLGVALLFSSAAHAAPGAGSPFDDELVPDLGGGRPHLPGSIVDTVAQDQLGDTWGKKAVTADNIGAESLAFQRAARATAHVNTATGFYLGTFAGFRMMATNHHVMPSVDDCDGTRISFPLLGVTATCQTAFGSWTDIDLALFAIDVSDADAAKLEPVAQNFAFNDPLVAGQELVTLGFGRANNPNRDLMGNQDDDCRVVSKTADYRFMGDPDTENPGDYQTWSFANGCDVSHGDSGSAMVDRATSKVVGILWTGAFPKVAEVQNSPFLESLVGSDHTEVWTELTYSVPAPKIGDFLAGVAGADDTPAQTKAMLGALLAN
jgi:hypothetical protein